MRDQATTELTDGVPFISQPELTQALDKADVPDATADAVLAIDSDGRLDALRVAFGAAAILAVLALFGTGAIPRQPVGSRASSAPTASA